MAAALAFPQAVASFEPTSDSILLWTRSPIASEVEWQLSLDAQFTAIVESGRVPVHAEDDHCVTVTVDGLPSSTTLWYRFLADSVPSPVGRTRTLPAAPAERLVVGLVSCARFSVAPLTVYRALANREVDLVLHLGDYIYEDEGESGPRSHDPPHRAVTLDDYRRRLAQIRSDRDCQALHLRHPMSAIWDDHDLADNAWRTGAKKHDPEADGPWIDRVKAAARARHEYVPARLREPDDLTLTWRSIDVGDLAEVLLLDTRYAGRDQHAGDEGTASIDDPQRSLLGSPQRAWLHERLADASRPWAVVASSVVINTIALPGHFGVLGPLLPNGYAVIGDELIHDDQWDGYPAERERLVEAIGDRNGRGGRCVLLSGDVHSSWAFDGPHDDTGRAVAVEATVPSVSSAPMGRTRFPGVWRVLDTLVKRLEHVRYTDITGRGYAILDITRAAVTIGWWHLDVYATDDEPTATLEAAFRLPFAERIPRFVPVDEEELPEDPVRPDLPARLPARPDDVVAIRRAHQRRRYGSFVGIGAVVGAVIGGGTLALVRRFG